MQKLRILLAVCCGLIFSYLPLSAQFEFKKGFIVTSEGDTLSGLLKDRSHQKLSNEVTFKTNRKDKVQTFKANEIRAFGFADGDVFEAFEIEYVFFDRKKKLQKIKGDRFLIKLVEGKVSLYELAESGQPLFIKKEDASLQLLCIRDVPVTKAYNRKGKLESVMPGKKYWDKNNQGLTERGGKFYGLANEYIDLLRAAMADCPGVKIADDLPLTFTDIYELVVEYNKFCAPKYFKLIQAREARRPIGQMSMYTNIPFAYFEEYGGHGFGAMLETGGEKFSFNIGFEHVVGKKNAKDYNYKYFMTLGRVNYRIVGRKRLTPYVFLGVSMNFKTLTNGIEAEGLRKKFFLHPEVGVGADLMLNKKFFLKGEVSYPHFPNVRLGFGFLIQ